MWWLLISAVAWGAKIDKAIYPRQWVSGRAIDRIEVIGVRGTLKLTGARLHGGNYRLKVGHTRTRRAEDWNLSVERRGHTLVLEVSNAAYGREWRRLMRQDQWPEFDIDLEGPSVPATVSWREGSLNYKNWQAPLETSFLNGDVWIHGGSGNYVLQAVNSRIRVDHFKGSMDIKGEQGQVELFAQSGRLNVSWLQGLLTLIDVQSEANLDAHAAEVRIRGSSGLWQVKSSSGPVTVTDFSGRLRGTGGATRWVVRGRAHGELELVNASGPVQVDWKSAAKVFLTSSKGVIKSPFVTHDRDGRKVAEGRKGSRPLGQVFVRTETGDITFKY